MRKPPTGEPCAGELHARFGGRGRRKPFPTPIKRGRFETCPYIRIAFACLFGAGKVFPVPDYAPAEPNNLLCLS
jgi:hypothetical protein